MTIVGQAMGLMLIAVASLALLHLPDENRTMVLLLLLPAIALPLFVFVHCWRDTIRSVPSRWLTGAAEELKAEVEVIRKARLIDAVFALVVIDTIVLFLLIQRTGGIGRSPLDPLLPVIPMVAIILRQPRRTVITAIMLQLFFAGANVLDWFADSLRIRHFHEILLLGLRGPAFDPHVDPNFRATIAVVVSGAISLSLLEYYFTHGACPFIKNVHESLDRLGEFVSDSAPMEICLADGVEKWARWLDSKGLDMQNSSLVHELDSVAEQAFILSIPYWVDSTYAKHRATIASQITFITYAAHWIDDHYDPMSILYTGKELHRRLLESPTSLIAAEPHVAELIGTIKSCVPRQNRCHVDRAILRIIYGGLIQNAGNGRTLDQLLKDYAALVSHDLVPELAQVYRHLLASPQKLTIWTTTKIVLELFEACTPTFDLNDVEFYNLLYAPVLYYHNIDEEVNAEHFGDAFGKNKKQRRKALPQDPDMVWLINTCAVLKQSSLPVARKEQLKCLLQCYSTKLPQVVLNAYEPLIS